MLSNNVEMFSLSVSSGSIILGNEGAFSITGLADALPDLLSLDWMALEKKSDVIRLIQESKETFSEHP